jgi:hypothetical protein
MKFMKKKNKTQMADFLNIFKVSRNNVPTPDYVRLMDLEGRINTREHSKFRDLWLWGGLQLLDSDTGTTHPNTLMPFQMKDVYTSWTNMLWTEGWEEQTSTGSQSVAHCLLVHTAVDKSPDESNPWWPTERRESPPRFVYWKINLF